MSNGTGWLSTKSMGWLERYMDLASARHELIAANIANVDTPRYHTRDLDFHSAMRRAIADSEMDQSSFSALPALPPPGGQGQEVKGLMERPDGNNVNLERESSLLAENQINFQIATQLMRSEFQRLRLAIQEGRTL